MSDLITMMVDCPRAAGLMSADRPLCVVDVRTASEHETHRIDGSHNIPLDALDGFTADIVHMGSPVLLVCQSGQRSRQAATLLERGGARNIFVLDGGLAAWMAADEAVVRGEPRMSLERQVRIVAGSLAATGGILALAVSPWFALLSTFVGSGLVYAGVSNTCMMATVLARMPYNRQGFDPTRARRLLRPEARSA